MGDVLDRAREEARRRRHATVDPEHLLLCLCAFPSSLQELRRRGIDVDELHERLESRLSRRAELGGYRDAPPDPELSARLEYVLERTVPRLPPRLPRTFDVELVESVLSDRAVAALLATIGGWDDSAAAVMTRARALAVSRGHPKPCLEHALRVLVGEPFFDAALRELAADVEGLRARLDDALAAPIADSPIISFASELASRHALAVRIVDDLRASPMLARCGIDSVDLGQVLVVGSPVVDVARAVPAHATVDVVVHDQKELTLELLEGVCGEAFDAGESHARLYAANLLDNGGAVVGTWGAHEARVRRARALLYARKRGVRLRVTLERVGTYRSSSAGPSSRRM
jgi:hypothetical protein